MWPYTNGSSNHAFWAFDHEDHTAQQDLLTLRVSALQTILPWGLPVPQGLFLTQQSSMPEFWILNHLLSIHSSSEQNNMLSENIRHCISHYSSMLALGRKCALHPAYQPCLQPSTSGFQSQNLWSSLQGPLHVVGGAQGTCTASFWSPELASKNLPVHKIRTPRAPLTPAAQLRMFQKCLRPAGQEALRTVIWGVWSTTMEWALLARSSLHMILTSSEAWKRWKPHQSIWHLAICSYIHS